jgi:hypothetical protein
VLVRYLRERGVEAAALETAFGGEEGDDGAVHGPSEAEASGEGADDGAARGAGT